MIARDLLLLARRNLGRRRARTALTALGVALAVFLLSGIESFATGLTDALGSADQARTLVVYRKNRWCPQTSFLPERYAARIEEVEGVQSVLPVKVFLNNCRTNLDMIVFHGTPADRLFVNRDLAIVEGSKETFLNERDAALVGRAFAERRGLKNGDKFRYGDVTVKVGGIFAAEDPTQEGLVLVHLEYLQRSGSVSRLGTVTQFEVRLRPGVDAEQVGRQIDECFASTEEPTFTRSRAAFLARATRELAEIVRFGRLFGLACVLVVIVLIANTISISVHERRREMGVLRVVGFKTRHLLSTVLLEALLMAVAGSLVGALALLVVLRGSGLAIGVEGVQVAFSTDVGVLLKGVGIALAAALAAGSLPAMATARGVLVRTLRSGG